MAIRKVSAVVRSLNAEDTSDGYEFKGAIAEAQEQAYRVAGYADAVGKAAKGNAPDYELRLALENTRAAALRTAKACERAVNVGGL